MKALEFGKRGQQRLLPEEPAPTRRDFLATMMAASGLAGLAPTGTFAANAPDLSQLRKPSNVSPAMQQAWERYLQGLEEIRRTFYSHEFAESPRELNAVHYLLHEMQATSFNLAIAPRPEYPKFILHGIFDPVSYNWIGPGPDQIYRLAFLDGARDYRIWGKRGNTLFFFLQSTNSYFMLPPDQLKLNGSYDLKNFKVEPDGSFEIIASAQPHAGNWIKLDPAQNRNLVMTREYFPDWGSAQLSELHVEPMDDIESNHMVYDEAEMIRRLEAALMMMRFAANVYSHKVVENTLIAAGGHYNTFQAPELRDKLQNQIAPPNAQGNPNVVYNAAVFDIDPDEALIVEIDPPPDSKYWSIQLTDVWDQTIDFTFHQGSLNMVQARADADGKVRVVLSHRDPGVHNWVTPVDQHKGNFIVRWLPPPMINTVPTARNVAFHRIRDYLPKETVFVTPQERKQALRARRRAMLKMYGY